jgi:hypothetical protein
MSRDMMVTAEQQGTDHLWEYGMRARPREGLQSRGASDS